MKKSKFSEHQIVNILKEYESGKATKDICKYPIFPTAGIGHKCLDLSNKMKKTRFTETQIVRALKEGEEGRKTDDICRELEISKATFYNWKSRYGGMEASDVKRLKELEELEEENARLKKMFAELSMNHDILKEVITKKGWGPGNKNS